MAWNWAKKVGTAGIFLGGIYVAFQFIDSARGTVDPNERLKSIMQAASIDGINRPLELSPREISTIEPISATERLRVSGELRPVNQAILRAKRAGKIIEITARDGEIVKAGDVLVRFETAELQSILKQREADREVADAERLLAVQSLDRTEQLARKNIASREQLDKAKAEVAAATARLESLSAQVEIARTALQEAEVQAPFDGVAARVAVNEGSYVAADAELVSVVDTSVLEARMLVSTRDVLRIVPGQIVELLVDGLEREGVEGRVARIGAVADDGSRFVPVFVRLANRDGRLKGGMFATGTIVVRENRDILIVPVTALREDGAGHYVLKLKNGLLVRQAVTVGARWNRGDAIEISDGLDNGDTIVTAPLPGLQPDSLVTMSRAG